MKSFKFEKKKLQHTLMMMALHRKMLVCHLSVVNSMDMEGSQNVWCI